MHNKENTVSDAIPAAAAAPASSEAPASAEPTTINQQGDALEKAADEHKEAQATASAKKKYDLKVNGKSKSLEFDPSNEAEVIKYLQKAAAADEKFEEAAMTRKQMEYLVEQLRTNPLAVLSHEALGINVKEFAQKIMEQELEDLAKSPDQKRIEELENKLKEKEAREKALEDDNRQKEMARLEAENMQALDDQISGALAESSLPKSPYVVKRLVDAMIEAVNLGYVDVTAKQIMPFVEEQVTEEIQKLFETSPDEMVEKLISKKRLDGYRKARVTKAKTPAANIEALKTSIKDTGSKDMGKKKEEQPAFRVKDLFKF